MRPILKPVKLIPDDSDLREAKCRSALLPVQWVDLETGGVRKRCLTFFDSGSNVTIIRRKMAEEAGLTGWPAVCNLTTTG